MKNYKEYSKNFIGFSDIATLVCVGMEKGKLKNEFLHFGEDGRYYAYFVEEDTKIPSHYEKICTFHDWMKIYDDEALTLNINVNEINVYRAGDFGCIIQLTEKEIIY